MRRRTLLLPLILLLCLAPLFPQESDDGEALNPTTGFPEIKNTPFVTFDYGPAVSWVTRLQFQTERSNFVLEDTMVGLYAAMRTASMKPVDSVLRIAAYYPLVSTFNKVPQASKQTLLYAFDAFYAPLFQADMWKYVRISFAPGLHFLYQLSDNWHYMSLGAGILLGAELPLAQRWTVFLDGMGSFDYANLGSNAQMFPFNLSWQYQLALGVRCSKRKPNAYSYITSRKRIRNATAPAAED